MFFLVLALLTAFAFPRWLLRSTPVSEQEAIDRFRSQRAAVEASRGSAAAPATRASGERAARARRVGPVRLVAEGSRPADALTRPIAFRPAEGTYPYDAEGEEGIPGYRRDLGGLTWRNVIHEGPRTWQDHHLFRKERESWTHYGQDDRGRFVSSSRNRIAFGDPEVVTLDETVVFTPALRGALLPWREGKRWEGTFDGETYGSYRAATLEHGWMRVDGQRVEYWLDRLEIELHGKIEGTVDVKRWMSPRYGLVLREEYHADAKKGPITYTARWSVTLRSLTPRR